MDDTRIGRETLHVAYKSLNDDTGFSPLIVPQGMRMAGLLKAARASAFG
jgi:hypothetical protein